jgi:hypothetical protein
VLHVSCLLVPGLQTDYRAWSLDITSRQSRTPSNDLVFGLRSAERQVCFEIMRWRDMVLTFREPLGK